MGTKAFGGSRWPAVDSPARVDDHCAGRVLAGAYAPAELRRLTAHRTRRSRRADAGAGQGQPDAEWVLRARQGAGPSKQRPAQQGPGIVRLTTELGAEWLPAWSTASTVKRCAVGAGPTTASR